jgi:dUTP pyrophosphatase
MDKESWDKILRYSYEIYTDIKLKKLHKDAIVPTYGTKDSACVDLYAVEDVTIRPGELKKLRSGLAVEMPRGHYIEMYNRSSMAGKRQLLIVSSCVIDEDYRGEIYAPIKNIGDGIQFIRKGDRFAQMMIKKTIKMNFIEVDELKNTERGAGGFGSTGQ